MNITIEEIKQYVSTTIYQRGQQYYKAGLVDLINIDEHSIVAHVLGNELYIVRINEQEGHWFMDCDCPYWDNCKHMVATLLEARDYYEDYPEMITTGSTSSWQQTFANVFMRRNSVKQKPSDWQLGFILEVKKTEWTIQPCKFFIKKDGSLGRHVFFGAFGLSSSVNCTANDLNAFESLLKSQNISLLSNIFMASILSFLPNSHIGDFFTHLDEAPVFLNENDELVRLYFSDEKCHASFNFSENEDSFYIEPKLTIGKKEIVDLRPFTVLSRNPVYLLRDDTLYRIENLNDGEMLAPFTFRNESITIPKSEMPRFLTDTYPKLVERTPLKLPDSIKEKHFDTIDRKEILLEEEPSQLRIYAFFWYGTVKVSFDDHEPVVSTVDGNVINLVTRNFQAEYDSLEVLFESKIKKLSEGGWRVTDKRAMNWLFKYIPVLVENGFDILGRENLKRYKVRTGAPNVSVNITSDLDWFDIHLNISIEGIELSLKELRKSIRKKTRFVKLVDHSIAQLPQEWFDRFRQLFHFADTDSDSDHIHAASTQAPMMDMLFNEAQKQTDKEFEACLKRLENFEGLKEQQLPGGLEGQLRPYQKAGYDWLCFLNDYGFGGCLADDMGLGKTIQALTLLQREKELGNVSPNLIVCPTSVVFNWQQEVQKFTPKLRTVVHTGIDRDKSEEAFNDVDLVLTTYGVMLRDYKLFKDVIFHYIILDESQKIKNPNSQTASVARLLRSSHRLCLTGTPVENNVSELWSQFAFLNPGMLGSLNVFRSEFSTQIEKYQNQEAADMLKRTIYPFIMRRTKEKVAKDLPDKSEQTLLCDLSDAQRKVYEQWRDIYRAKILKLIDEKGLDKSKMNVLEGLTKLRQIACHPVLVESDVQEESGKFEMLFELIEDIVGEGHKVLLFSQFVKMLSLIRARFEKLDIPYEYLDGRTRKRKERVERFQNDESIRAFLISLKAGGTGLNLTAADYVIHYDPWWNPAVEVQATDRTHRIGQSKNVFVYKLISKDTVEEKILTLQQRKQKLVSDLITTDAGFMKQLSKKDVDMLFS